MATSGRGTGIVGYNVQAAVDTEHHMIVAHAVTNVGHDRAQLTAMSTLARDAIGGEKLTVLADRGYFDGEEIRKCVEESITTLVPKPITSNSRADGRFDKRDFIYIAKRDEYRCPAGERAIWRMTTIENDRKMHRYWPSACRTARSSRDAHPAIIAESHAGNMSRCWTPCSTGWIALRTPHGCVGKPSSIRLERSRRGWGRTIS